MRTTLDIPEAVLVEARALAARTGREVDDLVSEALQDLVRSHRPVAKAAGPDDRLSSRMPISTCQGGAQPGVDLSDSRALSDLLDGIR